MGALLSGSIERKRGYLLLVIMTAVSVAIAGITLLFLYNAAFSQQEARLVEIAQSRARLMEAIARDEQLDHDGRDAFTGTLAQLREAHEHFAGFGRTGEFTLAEQQGHTIVFLLRHRHSDLDKPSPVALDSGLAEPMQQALAGRSGTMVGIDYRGERVLAAFEPVRVLDLGIVAKIDLAEVRQPFLEAGLLAGGVGLVLILLGLALFLRIGGPMITQLERSQQALAEAQRIGRIGSWDFDPVHGTATLSDEMYRLLGLEPLQRHWSFAELLARVPAEDRDQLNTQWEALLAGTAPYQVEHRMVLPDGTEKVVHAEARIERGTANRVARVIGISQDITDRKRVEEQLKRSVREKEVLLREIHHRVKNNLQVIASLLALQWRGSDNEQVVKALRESEQRVQAMALIHTKLYRSGDLAHVDFKDYLADMVAGLYKAYKVDSSRIELRFDMESVLLGVDQAIPCAQIVSELVSNSLQHAFPEGSDGFILVCLRSPQHETVEISVCDNGVGLPQSLGSERPASLGLWLVQALSQQLEGQIETTATVVEGAAEPSGTTVRLSFSRPEDLR